MANVIEEFVARLGWEVDPKGLDEFNKQVDGIADTFKKVALAIAGATVATVAFANKVNTTNAILDGSAKALGTTSREVENVAGAFTAAGATTESVLTLFRKLGVESGKLKLGKNFSGAKIVSDLLKAINIEAKEFAELPVAKQFTLLSGSLQNLESDQAAAAAAQQLFGRQGAKFIGFLRLQEESIEDILEKQDQYNLFFEDARKGAIEYFNVLDPLMFALNGLKSTIAGYLGTALKPILKTTLNWIVQNRELLKQNIKDWVKGLIKFLRVFWSIARSVVLTVKRLTDAFGGMGNALKILAIAIAAIKVVKLVVAFSKLAVSAKSLSVALALVNIPAVILAVLLVALALVLEDLYVWFQGGESVLGKFGKKFSDVLHDHVKPFFAELFELSNEEFDMKFLEVLDEIARQYDQLLLDTENLYRGVSGFFKRLKNDYFAWVNAVEKGINIIAKAWNKLPSIFKGGGLAGTVGDILLGGKKPKSPEKSTEAFGPTIIDPIYWKEEVGPILNPSAGITNNQQNNNVTMNNKIEVTQLPGENGQDLANRITKTLESNVAQAVRSNATGIVV